MVPGIHNGENIRPNHCPFLFTKLQWPCIHFDVFLQGVLIRYDRSQRNVMGMMIPHVVRSSCRVWTGQVIRHLWEHHWGKRHHLVHVVLRSGFARADCGRGAGLCCVVSAARCQVGGIWGIGRCAGECGWQGGMVGDLRPVGSGQNPVGCPLPMPLRADAEVAANLRVGMNDI